jgi:hypothetical protein
MTEIGIEKIPKRSMRLANTIAESTSTTRDSAVLVFTKSDLEFLVLILITPEILDPSLYNKRTPSLLGDML